MASNIGKVKSVLSGDTVVLQSTLPPDDGQQPLEKTLSLAYVQAPRFKREGDEPGAFESREYLRKLLVGKEVPFGVLYTTQSNQRDYGLIWLPTGESVVELIIKDGMAKVRDETGKSEENEGVEALIERLKSLEVEAKNTKGFEAIEVVEGQVTDPQAFLEEWKGKKIQGIIERVIAGDRLAIRLLLGPKQHRKVVLLIAGIRCPRSSNAQDQRGEEYGDDARLYVETRLLQRTITVELLGASPQGQLLGAVTHHQRGSIAGYLLQEGLARCEDFHSTLLGGRMSKLRAAEKKAKEARLNIWKGLVVKKFDNTNSFDAVVSRIIWVDQLMIRNKAGQEKKISLSSIRGPKNTDPKQAPWQAESKEFLRKKLIGKHVRVGIDGKKPATEGYEEREACTVMFSDKNIALDLVEAGYASVIRHRRDDEDRSSIYDELLEAEEKAQSLNVGMWSDKPPASAKIVEASETLQKAKTYLSFLQRQKRIPAVVDYVASGSRFKVIIPRENARLTFVLGGIRAPRTARNPNETSEPFGQEALDYASKKCMQRDVEIDVEDIDRVGGFIGTLYVGRENLAKALVEEGLAAVHAYSAEKGSHGAELFAAEKRAKELKKGMWHNYDPAAAEVEKEAKNTTDTPSDGAAPEEPVFNYIDVRPTHVNDENCHVWLQLVKPNSPNPFRTFEENFHKYYTTPSHCVTIPAAPKSGGHYAVKFSEDGKWYRGIVKSVDRDTKTGLVLYPDYGNSEHTSWNNIGPLPPQFAFSAMPAASQECTLSFIQFPINNAHYMKDAAEYMRDVMGAQTVANVEYKDPQTGLWYVSILDPKGSSVKESVNADLVRDGLAMAARKPKPFERAYGEVLKQMRELEELAKSERLNMWEYGDISEDD